MTTRPRLSDQSPAVATLATALPALGRLTQVPEAAALFGGQARGHASASEADFALCRAAAAFTQEPAVVAAVLEMSGLSRAKHRRRDYVERTVAKAIEVRGDPADKPRASDASRLLEIIVNEADLFHDGSLEVFATFEIAGRRETRPINSVVFRRWVRDQFSRAVGRVPSSQAVKDALANAEGRAQAGGRQDEVFIRVADLDGEIWIDLADDRGRAIRVDSKGWEISDTSPVRFLRTGSMRPLPEPVPGGNISELRQFVPVADDDWPLVVAWLIAAMRPDGPYPILVLLGEQGSAKSTTAHVLASLVDPNAAPLRSLPREERDLLISARRAWVQSWDNVSRLPAWLSDALCRLSTGGGLAVRKLYSDDDEKILDAKRPIILNGIEDFVTRADLLDRSLIVYLATISETRRLPEATLKKALAEARPRILGALLDATSGALKRLPDVRARARRLPRMADFHLWATAAEQSLGFERGTIAAAYKRNRELAHGLAIEAAPVAQALVDLVEKQPNGRWKGTASVLLAELNRMVRIEERRYKNWPRGPEALGSAIRRAAPNLRAQGIEVKFDRTRYARTITIKRRKEPS